MIRICCRQIDINFRISKKFIWVNFTKYLRKAYHFSSTFKVTSVNCRNQNKYVNDLQQAPPFSIINLFFCSYKNTCCKTIGI